MYNVRISQDYKHKITPDMPLRYLSDMLDMIQNDSLLRDFFFLENLILNVGPSEMDWKTGSSLH